MRAEPESFRHSTKDVDMIPNILAERYATAPMKAIWSPEGKVRAERRLWIAVLRAQKELGHPVENDVIGHYEAVVDNVDLDRINRREKTLNHDVKARIEEFNNLAGHQAVHAGMTSRDSIDNVEQAQIRDSMNLMRDRAVAVLRRFYYASVTWKVLEACGRSHNVPAQGTTLGRRFSMWDEEMLLMFNLSRHFIEGYPLRGIKGAVGTQQDMSDLLGSPEAAVELDARVTAELGFSHTLTNVGQVYPRSLDFAVVAALLQLAAAPGNFATTMRLMAGQQQVSEGFKAGQTGSTAMPHKMNMRTCERICSLLDVLRGHLTMAASLVGHQWYEGDVSCSAVRRVFLPDAFFALDGLFEATMHVLDEMVFFESMLGRELATELPFLSSSRLLMAAVKKGMGREAAHAVVKQHATKALERVRNGEPTSVFVESLTSDSSFPLSAAEIEECLVPECGRAVEQVEEFEAKVVQVLERYPEAALYNPEPIR